MKDLQLEFSPLDSLQITSEKGDRISPSNGNPTVHEGMDFAASDGTNLYCAHKGNVIYSGFRNGYGNMIAIQDPESGQATLYAHLRNNIVLKGDIIGSERTLIGKTGNSGTKAFHLHFEVLSKEVADRLRDNGDLPSKGGRLNPRTYIANSPFASMLSSEVHSRKLGLESREGDRRDNIMYRDDEGQMLILNSQGDYKAAPITFRGLEGVDTYEIPVSYEGYTTVPKYDENGNPVLRNTKQVYEEFGPQVVYSQDLIDDIDNDGIVIIKKPNIRTVLTGSIPPKTDALGNKLENVWTYDEFDLRKVPSYSDQGKYGLVISRSAESKDGNNKFKLTIKNFPFQLNKAFGFSLGKVKEAQISEILENFKIMLIQNMKNLLVTTLVIFSSLIYSASAKEFNQEQDPVIRSQIEAQRIKLGIEELRKKYPISLLDEKKKKYKTGDKINIDNYSEAEIKAAFLNADKNFVSRKKIEGRAFQIGDAGIWVDEEVSVRNQQELIIIGKACDKLRHSDWSKLNKKWGNLFDFIFSDNIQISYYTIKYVPREKAGFCLDSVEEARGL